MRRVDFAPGSKVGREAVLALRRKTGMVFQNFQLFPHRRRSKTSWKAC